MTTSHSDLVIQIGSVIRLGFEITNERTRWQRFLDKILNRPAPHPLHRITYKLLLDENYPMVRAGYTIETDNGLQWMIIMRSMHAFVVDSLRDDITTHELLKMDDFCGSAFILSQNPDACL